MLSCTINFVHQQGKYPVEFPTYGVVITPTKPLRFSSDRTWEVGLACITARNSIHNVMACYGNNVIRYYNGTYWRQVILPDGSYDLNGFIKAIHRTMLTNGDFNYDGILLTYNINLFLDNTGHLIVQVANGYRLDLSIGSLHAIFGFEPTIVEETTTGPYPLNLMRDVETWVVHCSIANDLTVDHAPDIIHWFSPRVSNGETFVEEPKNVHFRPLLGSRVSTKEITVENITVWVTDQFNRPIWFPQCDLGCKIIIRQAVSFE